MSFKLTHSLHHDRTDTDTGGLFYIVVDLKTIHTPVKIAGFSDGEREKKEFKLNHVQSVFYPK